jgi:hypothetical protein
MAVRASNILYDNQFVITDLTAKKYEMFFEAFVELVSTEDVEPLKLFEDLKDIWEHLLKGVGNGNRLPKNKLQAEHCDDVSNLGHSTCPWSDV